MFIGGLSSLNVGFHSMAVIVDGKDEKTVTDGLVGGVRGGFLLWEAAVDLQTENHRKQLR